jgi:hypothetical protein
MLTDLFYTHFKHYRKLAKRHLAKGYPEYNENQARGEGGRWTAGRVARTALGAGAALGTGLLAIRNPARAGRFVGNLIGAARYGIKNPARAGSRVIVGARRGLRDLNRSNLAGAALSRGLGGAAAFGSAVERGGARFGLNPMQSAGAVGGGIGGALGGYIGLRRQQRQ